MSQQKKILTELEVGKEYYFATDRHAAIIRKTELGIIEYLELQNHNNNSFHPLSADKLKRRFGAQKSHTLLKRKYEVRAFLVSVDETMKRKNFRELLGYLNTSQGDQLKGIDGKMR